MQVSMPPSFTQRLDIAVSRNEDASPEAEGILGRTMHNLFTGVPLVSFSPIAADAGSQWIPHVLPGLIEFCLDISPAGKLQAALVKLVRDLDLDAQLLKVIFLRILSELYMSAKICVHEMHMIFPASRDG